MMLYCFVMLAYLLLPFLEFQVAMAQTPPTCTYNEIPTSLPTECTTLTIQNANLRNLLESDFSHLNGSNISMLIISENRITNIGRRTFQSFPALTHLDASNNLMTRLDSGVFLSLHELTHLYLHANKISSISSSAFEELENLEVLRLDNNQLTDIDSAFSDISDLETLNLTFNNIREISADTFNGLTKLHYLFLGYNHFSKIPEAIRDGRVQKLYTLNLRSNQINTTLTSSHLHNDYLEELYLSNNDIPALSDNFFMYLRRLQVLHLDFNRLTNFHAWLDQHPLDLQEIRLDANQWDCDCTNVKVWEQLQQQSNLRMIERNSTVCVTPSSRSGEIVYDLATSCKSGPLLSTTALIGITIASAVILTGILVTACVCCCPNKCRSLLKMKTKNPAKSPQGSVERSENNEERPHHEYHFHVPRPKGIAPARAAIPNGQNRNGKLVHEARDPSTLNTHIYHVPDTGSTVDYLVPIAMEKK